MYGTAGSSSRRVAWRRPAAASGGGGGGGAGPFISHPRFFPRLVGTRSRFLFRNSGSTIDPTSGSWNLLSRYGVCDESAYSANVWKTILSATGTGLLYGIIGPHRNEAGSFTFDIRVTVDGGTPWTVTFTVGQGAKAYIGNFANNEAVDTSMQAHNTALDDTKSVASLTDLTFILPNPSASSGHLRPLLFSSSLLVEMRVSVNISLSWDTEPYSVVIYRMCP